MGKKHSRGKNWRQGGGGRGGRGGGDGSRSRDHTTFAKENENLQRYYDDLLQLPEEEKQQYWEALRRELPNSFRFCGSKGHALAVERLLRSRYIPDITSIGSYDGRPVSPPMPVSWYPDELAWWMTTPKQVVRKFPPFAAFQKFLVSETSVGNISRQEVVSMIPPLLMDLRPGMTCLDMCAAPGSKAAQLLEMIHQGEEARVKKVLRAHAKEDGRENVGELEEEVEADLEADPSDDGRATGLLIANDSDYKRGHMLVHQLKRLSSPNLLVTNHDATQFPSIKLPSKGPQAVYLKFDRILADVPCSGDGTVRKNANIWKDWLPGNALGLHVTQVRILVRALQMLKVGGRVVYSTCSMNPVENEAVISSAIDRCGGLSKISIVDCSDDLPGLKRYPGMRSWKIMDKSGRIWSNWEDVKKFAEESNEGIIPSRLTEGMLPSVPESEAGSLPLERCMRVYPHMQDTGGFFITVLEKKAEFKARNENEPKQQITATNGSEDTAAPAKLETQGDEIGEKDTPIPDAIGKDSKRPAEADAAEEPAAKKAKIEDETSAAPTPVAAAPSAEPSNKPRRNGPAEEPFKYLDSAHPIIQNIKEFYKVSTRFPDNRYMVRNEVGEPAKAIYYTTSLMRDILTENEGRGMKFIHGGVRMYMKQDAPSAEVCRWRIQSEGMPILQGYVGEPRIIRLRNKETLRKLLIEMFPRIAENHWQRFDEIGEQVRDIGMGCCVLRIEPDGSDPDFTEKMALPLWKSIHSLNLMLPKEDRSAMLLRIFNDSSPLINTTLSKPKFGQLHQAPETDADDVANGVDDAGEAGEELGEDTAAIAEDEADTALAEEGKSAAGAVAENGDASRAED